MSFNGSGVFSINTAGQPVVMGTTITSTAFNAFTADIATGLSTCMLKDGTQTATAGIGFYAGTVSLPGIYFGTDTATGLYRIGLNNTGYSINGTKLLDLSAAAFAVTGTISATSTISATTSLLTPSTTFNLVNTTATTVNFAGAATTLNIGNVAGTNIITGYKTAIYGDGTDVNSFRVQRSSANVARIDLNYYKIQKYNGSDVADLLEINTSGGGVTLGNSGAANTIAGATTFSQTLTVTGEFAGNSTGNASLGGGFRNTSTGSGAYTILNFGDSVTTQSAYIGLVGSGNSAFGGARSMFLGTAINTPVVTLINNSEVTRVTSTGLAVTGVVDINGTAASATASHLQLGSTTQSTIGANGAASALTANPLGYLIAYLGSTKIVIPYYNA